ncbi:pro-sigmaK processing inhibitor BofA family protein [Anaeromicropila populeti]|uniref:Inhibitor of the pro-sigma K processing machinery n=1 Tax=Anaeromicropila populeti TaxID=37658 RepID=A0A1I6LDK0_9FIRM|nr:pro-sigmaK processing inhibitor BofA family protein [Anaeromicropila populeti]SFS01320.1 inhibitor of the pro-sigma K processing machinery [Anaeromicropila populeti]
MKYYSFILVLIVAFVFLLFSLLIRKHEYFINFMLRLSMGALAIYIVGELLARNSIDGSIGINPITLLTVGFLGAPGFVMMYAVEFYLTYCA